MQLYSPPRSSGAGDSSPKKRASILEGCEAFPGKAWRKAIAHRERAWKEYRRYKPKDDEPSDWPADLVDAAFARYLRFREFCFELATHIRRQFALRLDPEKWECLVNPLLKLADDQRQLSPAQWADLLASKDPRAKEFLEFADPPLPPAPSRDDKHLPGTARKISLMERRAAMDADGKITPETRGLFHPDDPQEWQRIELLVSYGKDGHFRREGVRRREYDLEIEEERNRKEWEQQIEHDFAARHKEIGAQEIPAWFGQRCPLNLEDEEAGAPISVEVA